MRNVTAASPSELPGVKKKSFSMPYNGGTIWFEHLDGMYELTDLIMEKLKNDSAVFMSISSPSLVAVNLDETYADESVINELAELFTCGKKRFMRIVFIGLDWGSKRKMKKAIKSRGQGFGLAFINDFEKAKEWLVSESF